ncbi:MAG: methyl-accepting chemotaxis protein [Nitrospirota bacterium]
MDVFKHLSVGKRLSICFGILFLLILVLGIFWQRGIVYLKDIEEKKTRLIELREKLRVMQLSHYKWVDDLRAEARGTGEFKGELDPKQCEFGKWYYSYELLYPELRELYNALEDPHAKFHESGDRVLKAVREGNLKEAERLSLHARQVLLPELMAVYNPFMKGIDNVYNKYKLASEKSIHRQKIISAFLVTISLVVVAILVIIMTRSIVKPLRRVTDLAKKISEGDIPHISEKEISLDSKNEIVQLNGAFNRMAASLSELSKTADKIASGDLTTTVRVRSEKDILAMAISKMVENLKHSLEELHDNSMKLALGMSDYFSVISDLSLGNLDVKASEDTGDDLLNQLGKATNNMIKEFRKLEECVEEVRRGNLEVKVPIRSEKDSLGMGFEHMLESFRQTSGELHSSTMNLAMGLSDYFFVLQQLTEGNLTVCASEDTGDDLLNQLGKVTNSMISSLKNLTMKVREQADFLANSSDSLASVSKHSTQSIVELSSAISLMSSATSSVAESSQDVSLAARDANELAHRGKNLMLRLTEKTELLRNAATRSVEAMQSLSNSSAEIDKIVNVMTKIAFQTNLLALNASIEAAKAGEYGHGFAVVAEEIRKLAEGAANSSRDIAKIIKGAKGEIEEAMISTEEGKKEMESGVAMTGEVSQHFGEITFRMGNIGTQIDKIAESSVTAATSAEEATASSKEQSVALEELAAAAKELSRTAVILQDTVARFKVQ